MLSLNKVPIHTIGGTAHSVWAQTTPHPRTGTRISTARSRPEAGRSSATRKRARNALIAGERTLAHRTRLAESFRTICGMCRERPTRARERANGTRRCTLVKHAFGVCTPTYMLNSGFMAVKRNVPGSETA